MIDHCVGMNNFGEPRRDGKDSKLGAVLQPLASVTG